MELLTSRMYGEKNAKDLQITRNARRRSADAVVRNETRRIHGQARA